MKNSIILPTYNERRNIVDLIKEVLKNVPENIECLVVDDNSPDKTASLVKKEFAKDKRVRCFVRRNERGLATAIKFGLSKAGGNSFVIMDSDFNHQPYYLPQFLKLLKDHDIVCGSRYIKGGGMPETPLRFLGSLVFNIFIQFVLGLKTTDNLSGFIGLKGHVCEKMSEEEEKAIFSGFGEWSIKLLWWGKQKKLNIKEIAVKYGLRHSGVSKMNFAKSLIKYTQTVLDLKIKGLT